MSAITGIATTAMGTERYAGRVSAWDGLGTVIGDIPTADFHRALTVANCDVTYAKDDVFDSLGNVIPGFQTVYLPVKGGQNDGGRDFSGIVGMRHELVQPVEVAELNHLINPKGKIETMGILRNSRFWIQSSGLEPIILDPKGANDVVNNFTTASNTVDGSGSLVIGDVMERWNCANVITFSLKSTKWDVRLRHTQSVTERMRQAALAIAAKRGHWEASREVFTTLFESPFSTKQFENAVITLNTKDGKPKDNEKGRLTKFENMMDEHMLMWNSSHNAGIRETAWGAWNVLLEVNQHFRKVQNTPNGQSNFFAAGAGFDGPTNTFRQDALTLVSSRAGVTLPA